MMTCKARVLSTVIMAASLCGVALSDETGAKATVSAEASSSSELRAGSQNAVTVDLHSQAMIGAGAQTDSTDPASGAAGASIGNESSVETDAPARAQTAADTTAGAASESIGRVRGRVNDSGEAAAARLRNRVESTGSAAVALVGQTKDRLSGAEESLEAELQQELTGTIEAEVEQAIHDAIQAEIDSEVTGLLSSAVGR